MSVDYVARNVGWGLKILKDMVAIPTTNPPGEHYWDFVKYAREVLESLGVEVRVVEVPAEYVREYYPDYATYSRYIVYAKYGEGKPVLHFNGHYDVVPAGSGWTRKPFDPVVEGGKLYGRGSTDMKGGIASFLVALKSVIDSGKKLGGGIEVALVPDEEIGGESGTGFLVRKVGVRPDYVVIGEPSGSESIWIGHKGAVWALVEVYGRQAHGATPWLGVNAFEYMVKIAYRFMTEYEEYLKSRKSVYEYDDPRGARPTVTIGGEVKGGTKINVVPGYSVFSIDRRVVPEERLENVEKEMVDFIKKASMDLRDVRVEVKIVNKQPPAITDPNSSFVKTVQETGEKVLGKKPRLTVCLGGLDMRFYTEANIPVVAYGPGAIGAAHAADEYLSISEFEKMAKIYYALIEKLLT
ncbi:MAG: M20 family metallopeptidase [Ignisphaera sp.]